jgi:hypothetical protein
MQRYTHSDTFGLSNCCSCVVVVRRWRMSGANLLRALLQGRHAHSEVSSSSSSSSNFHLLDHGSCGGGSSDKWMLG